MTITHYQIYGERSSGTNILDCSLNQNFDAINVFSEIKCVTDRIFRKYGHKHWFGNNLDLSDTDNTLFICILRNPIDWLKSLFRKPRCLYDSMTESPESFLYGKVESSCYIYSEMKPIDGFLTNKEVNPETGLKYNNIFELRHEKIKWMIEDLPKLVKNHIIIRYEDLISDFQGTMELIKNKGLKPKSNIENAINATKTWMKRDGYKNSKLKFAQPDPKIRMGTPVKCNSKAFNFELKDYPKEYIYYEKLLGYYN